MSYVHRWLTGSACLLISGGGAALGAPTYTGNVPLDFTDATTIIVNDPGGIDVGIPIQFPPGTVSGNDIEDFRLFYDSGTDILYVGFSTYVIAGDVDGDGNPGGTSAPLAGNGGQDSADFGGTEAFTLIIDVDEDGVNDVIAGVAGTGANILTGYQVAMFAGSPFAPGVSFGTPLPAHTGTVFGSPSASAPHLEFTITNFSLLPTSSGGDPSLSFAVNAFIGSFEDDGIGEDFTPGAAQLVQVCFDSDMDGVTTCEGDCDDNDPDTHPGADEVCDGADNDCDGDIDEGLDADGDGTADCFDTEECDGVDNDGDALVDEGFDADSDGTADCFDTEECDGVDNDGDALVDEGTADSDGDGLCDGLDTEECDGVDNDGDGSVDEGFDVDGDGYTTCGGDCDDSDDTVNPGADEVCDGSDNDCDGVTDEGFDADGDGTADCFDTEECDGVDNDGDGSVDEGFDVDGDGYTTCGGDCDDGDDTTYPGAGETCDGDDNDCDGSTDEGFDTDGDGVADCFDAEECDELDNDGDGSVDEGLECGGEECPAPEDLCEPGCYVMGNKPNGQIAAPYYGVRLDGLFGDASEHWTFSFEEADKGTLVEMCYYADGTVTVKGRAYGGEDIGSEWDVSSEGYLDIDFTYTGVTCKDGDTLKVKQDTGTGSGTVTYEPTGEVINLTAKADGNGYYAKFLSPADSGYGVAYLTGWMMYDNGPTGTIDWGSTLIPSGECPEEVCDELDNDLDGMVDEGASCGECVGDVAQSYTASRAVASSGSGASGDHAVWIPGLNDGDAGHVVRLDLADDARFQILDDGDARLTGTATVYDLGGGPGSIGEAWYIDSTWSYRGVGAAGQGSGGPKKELSSGLQGSEYTDAWRYFDMAQATLTQVGGDDVLQLSQRPSDGRFPLQVGERANNKNLNYGASSWFDYWRYSNGHLLWDGNGDFNIDLSEDCPGDGGGEEETCRTIDFDVDAQGNDIRAGQDLSNAYADFGLYTYVVNNKSYWTYGLPIAFDSANPTGGDWDLGTPNEAFGGPGRGDGGASNTVALGNLLISAENFTDSNHDGYIDSPDDDANGAYFIFYWDRETCVKAIDLVDLQKSSDFYFYDAHGNQFDSFRVDAGGDNSVRTIDIERCGVSYMLVDAKDSGAVDNLVYCDEGLPEGDECDGVDSDSDGQIDEDANDTDGDGICDGLDVEECDGIDNDGDHNVDEDLPDSDGDDICDDLDREECDGVDNDGDGHVDEGFDANHNGTPDCEEDACLTLDYETDSWGQPIRAGQDLSEVYSGDGVWMWAYDPYCWAERKAIAFNSSAPTGGDWDLGTPNQSYGGPGKGSGGASNDEALGNIMILAENTKDANHDGLVDSPDDDVYGGIFYFYFDEPVCLEDLDLIDVQDKAYFYFYDKRGYYIGGGSVGKGGDNSVIHATAGVCNVGYLLIDLWGSGGFDNIKVCPDTGSGHDSHEGSCRY